MSNLLSNRPSFGVPGIKNDTPAINNERKEMGCIWKFLTKANKPMYKVKLTLSKAKLEEILSKTTNDDIEVSLVGFDNEYANGDSKRPIIRMYEDREKK